jgi:drug/metabolite transporter (DMT)-like permease
MMSRNLIQTMELSQTEPTGSTVFRKTHPSDKRVPPVSTATVALSVTIFFWASAFVGIRAGLHGYSPTHLALLRYIVASLVLGLYAGLRRMPPPHWRDFPGLASTGVIGITFYNVMLNTGEVGTSAGIASFLVNTAPILTALLATVFLKERLRIWSWVGILICVAGVAIIAFGRGEGMRLSPGVLSVLFAALAQSLYFVLQKPYLARYSALQCTSYAVWAGTLALLLFSPGLLCEVQTASGHATVAAAYLGIFPGALGYLSWAYTLARVPAARAASFLYLVPPVTLGIAWFSLGEWPTWLALLGGTTAISGVVIVSSFGKTQTYRNKAK